MGEADLSKIVGLIMENPNLIAEIRALAEKSDGTGEKADAPEKTGAEEVSAIKAQPTREPTRSGAKRRELLLALKPYLSSERGKAVDQMLSLGDILDMMRNK